MPSTCTPKCNFILWCVCFLMQNKYFIFLRILLSNIMWVIEVQNNVDLANIDGISEANGFIFAGSKNAVYMLTKAYGVQLMK